MEILAILSLVVLIVAWVALQPFWLERKRNFLRSRPFPAAWRAVLRDRVPYFRLLPADLQLQLKQHIQIFMAEKIFIGCDGLRVTDEMRVTVAAQACLLMLNRAADYFPRVRQVLLYPTAFLVDKIVIDSSGVQIGRAHV